MPEFQPGWPESPAATGDPAVDSLLAGLPDLASTPVSGHGSVYASLHDGLLAELNSESGTRADAPSGVPLPGDPRAR